MWYQVRADPCQEPQPFKGVGIDGTRRLEPVLMFPQIGHGLRLLPLILRITRDPCVMDTFPVLPVGLDFPPEKTAGSHGGSRESQSPPLRISLLYQGRDPGGTAPKPREEEGGEQPAVQL